MEFSMSLAIKTGDEPKEIIGLLILLGKRWVFTERKLEICKPRSLQVLNTNIWLLETVITTISKHLI